MAEISFFGLSLNKSEWEFINSFANWFAGLGSILAAVVALYISNRAAQPRARVTVGHRIVVGPGSKRPYPEYVIFKIVNTGDRPIRISQIGWKTGFLRTRFSVQLIEPSASSPLPVEISHGQEAYWMVPLQAREEPWPEYFAKGMLSPHPCIGLWTLKAQFFSSVGYVFEVKPEERLRKILEAACMKLSRG